MKKRLAGLSKVTVTSLLAASLIAPNVASAAPYDIWNGTIKVGNLKDAILNEDSALLQDILDNANTYRYELGGKTYLYSEADAIAVANPNLTPTELDNKIATDLADKAENAPEESTDLIVQSVKASTITILPSSDVDTATYKLALDYLDKEGNVIPAAQLPTDLTVSYVDNEDVFNTDGTIKNKDKIPTSGSIKVVATVKSTAANINLTQEFEVTVVAANGWASVTDAKLVFNENVTGTVAVVGDSIKLVPTVATKNDGTKLEGDTAPTDWSTQVKSVTSSNITVLTAAKSSNDISLTTITAGSK